MSKAIPDKELSSKYKSYLSQVDKALKSFESTNDWADLIFPLGKLNKVNIHCQLFSINFNIYKLKK